MDEPRGFKRLPVVQAIQGNFDHLMAGIRAIVHAHNLMVGDLEGLQDQAETTDIQVAGHTHDGSDTSTVSHDDLTGVSANDHHNQAHTVLSTDHSDTDSTDVPDVGDQLTWDGTKWIADQTDPDSGSSRKRKQTRPYALFDYDHEHDAFVAPPGGKGDTGSTGSTGAPGSAGRDGVGIPWPGEDGAEGFFMPPGSGATSSGALTDHAHTATGDGGADLFPSGMTEIDGTLALSTWTSASLVGSVNDYHATGMETGIGVELTLSADWNITGLDFSGSGGPFINGQVFALRLESGDAHTLTLKHESASSVAANRFFLPGAADLSFSAGTVVFLVYHGGASRWNLWGTKGSTGATGATGAAGQSIPGLILESDEDPGFFLPGRDGATGAAGAPGASGGGGGSTTPSIFTDYADTHEDWGMPVPPSRNELHILNWSTKKVFGAGSTSDRWYIPFAATIEEVYFVLPGVTTSVATVDVKKNGTSIFGTKPTTSSAALSSRGVLTTTALARDDYLTFVTDKPGSAGGRLKVFVVLRRL